MRTVTIALTPSENKYLFLLAGGLTLKEIASTLNIKITSLNSAFYKIRKKLDVENNNQLVSRALTTKHLTKIHKAKETRI